MTRRHRATDRTVHVGRRVALLLTMVVALVTATSGVAFAYWSARGTGSGTGTTGTLAAPSAVTVPGTSNGTVAVSWTASTGSPAPTGYYVTRVRNSDSSTANACGTSSTSTTAATSCSDTSVPSGTYHYTVTAVFRSWTATSAAGGNVVVTVQTATKLAFTTQPPATTTGGGAFNVAVTVEDASSAAVLTAGTSVTVAIGTNPSAGTLSGTLTTTTNASGVATFIGLSIDKAGTGYTLTAISSGLTGATSNAVTITVGTASKLAFTTQPGGGTGGTVLAQQPVVKIQDPGGNTVTGNASQVTLAITAPANGATLTCTTNPVTASAGVATFAGCKIDKAGTYTLSATDGTLTGAQSASVTITVGTASQFLVTPSTTTPIAGTAFTATLTAADAGGNTVNTYTGAHTVTWSGGQTSPGGNAPSYPASSVTFASGTSTTTLTATYFSAGPNSLTASSTTPTLSGTSALTVAALAPTIMKFVNCSLPTNNTGCTGQPIAMGNNTDMTGNIALVDSYGNAAPPAGTVSIALSSSDPVVTVQTPSVTVSTATNISTQFDLRHNVNGSTVTITAHVSSGGTFADITMLVKK